jgi:hypothetical protein
MRTGNPNLFEPDVFADVEDGIWIEHTDLYPERLAERTENAQLFEVRLRDAIAIDLAIQDAIGDRYLVFSFEAPPSSAEIDKVCADVMRYLTETAANGRESPSVVVPDAYPLLRKHGLCIQTSSIQGALDATQRVAVSHGSGADPLPWPHGPAAKVAIEKKRAKKYGVDRPMWLLMTSTTVITLSDPTIPLLGEEPLVLAPFERFMFLADWSQRLLVDRRSDPEPVK